MIKQVIFVGIGGAAGSILRFLISYVLVKWVPSGFPIGTFTVNVVGSLIIGFLLGAISKSGSDSEPLRLLMGVGFCGGFTTFSAFTFENISFIEAGNYTQFATYTLISLAAGLLAVVLGLLLSRII